tara:strand:+ start:1643 stop:1843 length:201 start_codon:yes stop_codon:yes gene_type:complete
MDIELPECILLDDREKQLLKDAFLSYMKELEVKAKKEKLLTAEAYQEVRYQLENMIQKLHLGYGGE